MLTYRWNENFDFVDEVCKKFPIWVKLPSLPMVYWGEDSLSRICSVIGVPMCADECTSGAKRLTYARVRVEVDVTQKLLTEIQVENGDGRMFKQRVIYEWIPYFYLTCHEVGHVYGNVGKQEKRWVPKKKPDLPPVTPTETVGEKNSDNEGAWAAAVKVARSRTRQAPARASALQKLDNEFRVLQEGLQLVLEEKGSTSSI